MMLERGPKAQDQREVEIDASTTCVLIRRHGPLPPTAASTSSSTARRCAAEQGREMQRMRVAQRIKKRQGVLLSVDHAKGLIFVAQKRCDLWPQSRGGSIRHSYSTPPEGAEDSRRVGCNLLR